jgi:hypothetical protein
MLARDADAASAVIRWCWARLARIRDGEKPLTDLDQVGEAAVCLRTMLLWRRQRRASPRREPRPEGVWRERIEAVERELTQLAEAIDST